MSTPSRVDLPDGARLLVLTGAGVSAESGIPTFRGMGGVWREHRVEDVASPRGFARDPQLVWRFYGERRRHARTCEPNAGHHALADVERRLGDRFLLATQNVDGLHARAGSRRMVELHGGLFRTRCSRCDRPPFADDDDHLSGELPRCSCGALLRPDIVWFGEMLEPAHLERVERFMSAPGPLVFLAAGTSGAVWPAAGFVEGARSRGATTWLVNAGTADNAAAFDYVVDVESGSLESGLPSLLSAGLVAAEPR